MSRIGLKPVSIPASVEVKVDENNFVVVKGPKGLLEQQLPTLMKIEVKDGVLTVSRPNDEKISKSLHGLTRTLINNMIVGVTDGYTKELEIVGVGYRAQKKGNTLVLNLGYSHPVEMDDPEGIETSVEGTTKLFVKGINKQQVGNYSAVIRSKRSPEPYKGKGIKYKNEYIRRKAGKTAK